MHRIVRISINKTLNLILSSFHITGMEYICLAFWLISLFFMEVFSLRFSLETNAHQNPHIYGRWVIGRIVVFASFNVLFRLILLLLLLRSTPTIELTFPNDLSDFGPSPNYSSLMFVQFDELRSYDIYLFAHFHRVMMSSICPAEMNSRLKIASISWIIWANLVDSYSEIK